MFIKTARYWITLFAFILLSTVEPVDSRDAETSGAPSDGAPRFSVERFPVKPEPGGIVKIEIRGPIEEISTAEGSFGDQELIFQRRNVEAGILSIGGIDLETKPGKIPLTVFVRTRNGGTEMIRDEIEVRERTFGEQRLIIEEKPYTPELLGRIEREAVRFKTLWKSVTPERYWREAFTRPLRTIAITSEFGLKRFINEVPRKPHTGIDLRAAAGDTIYATNDGQVVLSGEFYFNGNTIVLDHGEGLYSMYFHLSGYIAKEGELVRRGQPIGLVGSTGRSTAPHLHWGFILRGARLDPLKVLELPIRGTS